MKEMLLKKTKTILTCFFLSVLCTAAVYPIFKQTIIDEYVKSISVSNLGSPNDTGLSSVTMGMIPIYTYGSCKECGDPLQMSSPVCPSGVSGCLVNHGHLFCVKCEEK